MTGVIYLTGVAGTGKSTVLGKLEGSEEFELAVFSYSEHLGSHLGRTREELRAASSAIVAASAIASVDQELADFVATRRSSSLVVIDSHAVTDESFGHRAIPFQPAVLASLGLDAVVCLTAPPRMLEARVTSDAAGRRVRSVEQIATGQRLQLAVAVNYSTQLGIPLYVVEADGPVGEVVAMVEGVFIRATKR